MNSQYFKPKEEYKSHWKKGTSWQFETEQHGFILISDKTEIRYDWKITSLEKFLMS